MPVSSAMLEIFLAIAISLAYALIFVVSMPESAIGVVARNTVFALIFLFYVICPVDPIPELVLGPVGFADELIISAAGVIWVQRLATGLKEFV